MVVPSNNSSINISIITYHLRTSYCTTEYSTQYSVLGLVSANPAFPDHRENFRSRGPEAQLLLPKKALRSRPTPKPSFLLLEVEIPNLFLLDSFVMVNTRGARPSVDGQDPSDIPPSPSTPVVDDGESRPVEKSLLPSSRSGLPHQKQKTICLDKDFNYCCWSRSSH